MPGHYNPSSSDSTRTPSPPQRPALSHPVRGSAHRSSPANAGHPAQRSATQQRKKQQLASWSLPGSNRQNTSGRPVLMPLVDSQHGQQQQHNARPPISRPQQLVTSSPPQIHTLVAHLRDLPPNNTPGDVYRMLARHNVQPTWIDMDPSRRAHGSAFVRFRVPTPTPAWVLDGFDKDTSLGGRARITLRRDKEREKEWFGQGDNQYPGEIKMSGVGVDFGTMLSEHEMMVMSRVSSEGGQSSDVQLVFDKAWSNVDIYFSTLLRDDAASEAVVRKFIFRIPISQIRHVLEDREEDGTLSFVMMLNAPPLALRKTHDIAATIDPKDIVWDEKQTWYRQTSLSRGHSAQLGRPTELQQDDALINIGRWLVYRFACDTGVKATSINYLKCALRDHNIAVQLKPIQNVVRPSHSLWAWLGSTRDASTNNGSALSALDDTSLGKVFLPFAVRYQLEVCISHGYLHEVNLDLAFGRRLAAMDADRAMRLLEKVAELKQRVFDPVNIFKMQGGLPRRKMPSYCTIVRSATITPTTVYFHSPSLDTSNRVIRQFSQHANRFLRVKFRDESYKGTIMAFDDGTTDELFARIKRTMMNGIVVGDRHYEFLAYGNSQFREAGAYFFAPTADLTTDKIRAWMGNFNDIKVVAKYASRVGQCFSTTRAMLNTGPIERIPDIKRNGFCFTDGVGKISPFLAMMTCREMGLPDSREECASVFQFRLGGCKGVLAVDPSLMGKKIQVRPSQEKFPADYNGLEICRISQYSTAYLNQQIVLVLSALGVTDRTLIDMLRNMLANLETAMTDEVMALQLLSRNIDLCQTTVTIASMIVDGFMQSGDPFTISILRLWRSWSTKYLKEKAKIFVEQGAFILGVVDETGLLKGHSNDTPADSHDESQLPEIFIQISDPEAKGKGKFKVVTGVCILARNPSLHPGDIRVVLAVDKPALRHLKNCVVLPQTGDRDIASMCSGGDLDGDDYLVLWDPALLPKEWNHPPMDYAAPPPVVADGPVTVDDMTSFFVTHMKNDNLPRIATAHRYLADRYEEGIKHEHCLELAALHSKAVDYAKTGVPAEFPKHLRVTAWPHWSENKNKKCYHSRKILGKLYDEVDRVPFVPAWDNDFDDGILKAYDLPSSLLDSVREVKALYDEALRRIMTQHGIQSEFEVWTTFVLEHNHESRDYNLAEELGETVSALKDTFKEMCFERAGTTKFERKWECMGPWVAGMYVVTAEQVSEANQKARLKRVRGGMVVQNMRRDFESMPFMSFPWMFRREMGEIANRRGGFGGVGGIGNGNGLVLSLPVMKLAAKTTKMDLNAGEALPELEEIDAKSYSTPTAAEKLEANVQQQDFPPAPVDSKHTTTSPTAAASSSASTAAAVPTAYRATEDGRGLQHPVMSEHVSSAASATISAGKTADATDDLPSTNAITEQAPLQPQSATLSPGQPHFIDSGLQPMPSLSAPVDRPDLRGAVEMNGAPSTNPSTDAIGNLHETAASNTDPQATVDDDATTESGERAGEVVELVMETDGFADKLDRLAQMTEM